MWHILLRASDSLLGRVGGWTQMLKNTEQMQVRDFKRADTDIWRGATEAVSGSGLSS